MSAQPCPPLRVRNPAGNYVVPGVQGDIPYSGELALDAYVQRGPGRRTSVVVIHGGGWSSGSRVAHIGQLLEALTQAGHNWFSIDYRLGGVARFADSLADLRRALTFIRCQAPRFGIDPTRLVLLGEDSGAHSGRAARRGTSGRCYRRRPHRRLLRSAADLFGRWRAGVRFIAARVSDDTHLPEAAATPSGSWWC